MAAVRVGVPRLGEDVRGAGVKSAEGVVREQMPREAMSVTAMHCVAPRPATGETTLARWSAVPLFFQKVPTWMGNGLEGSGGSEMVAWVIKGVGPWERCDFHQGLKLRAGFAGLTVGVGDAS
jgi:hypothetical protein